ncbi:hypothetical protein CTAYLR_010755 [Chrysophaeum taylorii]|uniref:Short-chain dehydrogenase/reductase n=1 Tax=Chrysophaeum taylorii TaxID=2483200 RepID=A0AAD7XJ09_9STRA|nr:hypothetical protein CTAYLR_010755 [Chrysophaeum taylorii]
MRVSLEEVVKAGNVAVVTGASSGIGKALVQRMAKLGMKVYAADIDVDELQGVVGENIVGVPTDVADPSSVEALAARVFEEAGKCNLLVNNAGIGRGGGPFEPVARYHQTLGVNTFGPIHGCQAFVPRMQKTGEPGIIVNTGSKQGITCPPGNLVYNVSKSALKTYTEGLEHELRSTTPRLAAALLVPGWVNTSIMLKSKRDAAKETGDAFDPDAVFFHEAKPAKGAWMPDQIVDFMLEELGKGRFYLIAPDNDVSRNVDNKRMTWTMQDITQDRPPLSRWHPDWKPKFEAFIAAEDEDS